MIHPTLRLNRSPNGSVKRTPARTKSSEMPTVTEKIGPN
jgi:hypothetical protein